MMRDHTSSATPGHKALVTHLDRLRAAHAAMHAAIAQTVAATPRPTPTPQGPHQEVQA
jgi:hypothetical protein